MNDKFSTSPMGILESIKQELRDEAYLQAYNEILAKAVEIHEKEGDRLYYLKFTDYLLRHLSELNSKRK